MREWMDAEATVFSCGVLSMIFGISAATRAANSLILYMPWLVLCRMTPSFISISGEVFLPVFELFLVGFPKFHHMLRIMKMKPKGAKPPHPYLIMDDIVSGVALFGTFRHRGCAVPAASLHHVLHPFFHHLHAHHLARAIREEPPWGAPDGDGDEAGHDPGGDEADAPVHELAAGACLRREDDEEDHAREGRDDGENVQSPEQGESGVPGGGVRQVHHGRRGEIGVEGR